MRLGQREAHATEESTDRRTQTGGGSYTFVGFGILALVQNPAHYIQHLSLSEPNTLRSRADHDQRVKSAIKTNSLTRRTACLSPGFLEMNLLLQAKPLLKHTETSLAAAPLRTCDDSMNSRLKKIHREISPFLIDNLQAGGRWSIHGAAHHLRSPPKLVCEGTRLGALGLE